MSITKQQLSRAIRSGDPALVLQAQKYLEARATDECQKNLKSFVQHFWPLVATSRLVDGWYLDAICDHLQHLTQLKRLLINIPPRHGKSSIVAVLYPAWQWIRKPSTKFLCSTYSLKDISLRDSIACRSVIESPDYQGRWGHLFKLSTDQNTAQKFSNDSLGFRFATSPNSGNTGEGCDIFIGDDLNNVSKSDSFADRQAVIRWWQQVMSSRMNPLGLDCKVVIQQRCHEEDITGFLLENEEEGEWTHLILPWEFESPRRCVTKLPWRDPRTREGEPLSGLLTEGKIKEIKGGTGMGPTGFACQYQQRPAPAEGAVFKKEWFRTYYAHDDYFLLDDVKIPKDSCKTIILTDLAISLKAGADWTVAQVWLVTPHNHLLLLDQYRDRVEGPDAIKQFKRLCNVYRPDALYVEDVAFQRIMIQMLRQAGCPVKGIAPQGLGDKKARAVRVMVKAECGQVWLPPNTPWLADYMAELLTFPNAAHDDMVDCTAWAGIVAQKYPIGEIPSQVVIPKEERLARREAEMMNN